MSGASQSVPTQTEIATDSDHISSSSGAVSPHLLLAHGKTLDIGPIPREERKRDLSQSSHCCNDGIPLNEGSIHSMPPTIVSPIGEVNPANEEQFHMNADLSVSSSSSTTQPQPPKQLHTGDFITLCTTSTPLPPQVASTVSPSSYTQPPHKIKRRRSSHRSKKRSSLGLEIGGNPGVSGGVCSASLEMSSDQVQNEIQAIDSILKALSTGGYSMSSMGRLSELTSGADVSSPTGVSGDTTGIKLHLAVKSVDSVSSYDSSRLDSTSSDSGSSTESSDESVDIGVPDYGRRQEDGEEEEGEKSGRQENAFGPKTKGETSYKDLPPIEQCDIAFPGDGRLLPIATVSHYTEKLLVIASLPDTPPVDEGTVLWTIDKTSIAKVFETFGPVKRPFYSIRINSLDDLPTLGVALGDTVYIVPADPSLTKYIFPQELMKKKGSDASWKDDIEVPAQFQDYSDDESEQRASKTKSRDRKKGKASQPSSSNSENGEVRSRGVGRQPSVKYTKDPHMQHYFPRVADLHQQPVVRPPLYPGYPPPIPPHMPPFLHPHHAPHADVYSQAHLPSLMTGVSPHPNPAFLPPHLLSRGTHPLRPLLPLYHRLPPPPPPPPPPY